MNKRKSLERATVLGSGTYTRDTYTCDCGYDMGNCLAANCSQPATAYTAKEVAAMEEKLARLAKLGTADDMIELSAKDGDEYLEGYQEGAFYVLHRVRAILGDAAGELISPPEAVNILILPPEAVNIRFADKIIGDEIKEDGHAQTM